jgi:hypothetical protein
MECFEALSIEKRRAIYSLDNTHLRGICTDDDIELLEHEYNLFIR